MNPSNIVFTSVDYYLNKYPIKHSADIFDLEKLASNFKLDTTFIDGKHITTGEFTRLEYSEKIGKGSVEKLINRPPIGPIPNNFMCTFCEQYGPSYHLVNCPNPSKRSLVLTFKGFKDLIKDISYTGPLSDDIKAYKDGKKLEILEKYFGDYIEKVKEGSRTIIKIPDTAFSEIVYDDVIKTKGKDPQAPKTLTTRFSNMVSIYYTLGNKTTNVRVYKDGYIDIKNIPQDTISRNRFITELIDRINETDSLNVVNFNILRSKNGVSRVDKYTLDDNYSYFYLYHSQFYMFGEENRKSQEIDFDELENLIEPDVPNRYISKVNGTDYLNVDSIDASIISKSKSLRGKKILTESPNNKVYLIEVDDINISLFITKYGVFQFSVSSKTDTIVEVQELLEIIKKFFINLFTQENIIDKTYITSEPAIYSMHDTQDSTVSGLVPPKSQTQRTGTEVCRKTQAGVALQPSPYSWTGNCAAENYAPAIGINKKYQGGDVKVEYKGNMEQLYYPCCEKLVGKAREDYIKRLKIGFTPQEQEKYGIFPDQDYLSGVLVPGSTKKGANAEVKLPGENNFTRVEVVSVPKKITHQAEYQVKRLSDSKLFSIKRENFKKDSRYFRGLDSLSKKELIDILIKENRITKGQKIDSVTEYEEKIDYINKFALLERFTQNEYKLTSAPDNTVQVFLEYKSQSNQYYINTKNKTKIESSVKFIEGTTIMGYYNEASKDFYPIYLLGIEDLDRSTELIENQLESVNDTVKDIEYFENYIEAADYLLKEEPNIRLLFVPTQLTSLVYKFDEQLVPDSITVQLIKSIGASRYTFGYNNQQFENESYQLLIPSSVKPGDYIKIKGRYNKITQEIDNLKPVEFVSISEREEKSFEKASDQFKELFNPIDIVFWTLNDGEYIIINDKKGIFDDERNMLEFNPI